MEKQYFSEVTNTSRRRFLKTVAVGGVGIMGLTLLSWHEEKSIAHAASEIQANSRAFSAHATVRIQPKKIRRHQNRLAAKPGNKQSLNSGRRKV